MNKIFTNRKCLSREEVGLYLNNQLTPAELQDIENHLLDCELCSDAIEGFQVDVKALDKLPLEWDHSSTSNKKSTKEVSLNKNKTWLSLAATLVILVVLGALIYQYLNKPSPQSLYADYFVPYPPNNSAVRGASDEVPQKEDQAMLNYGLRKYDQAIPLFEKHLSLNSMDDETKLYLGISYLETDQSEKAIKIFKDLEINSKVYADDAGWYLSLTYLKTKDLESAKEQLKKISETHSDYSSNAKELLTKLDQ